MKKFFYLILLILICLSCKRGFEKLDYNADTFISIDRDKINRKIMNQASTLIETIQYIPLETNNDNLVGSITKLILSPDYIHIHDYHSNNLYQFDYEGNFVRKIGTQGKGPKDYTQIETFSIDQNTGNIAIYCSIKQSIIEFTSRGIPISEKKLGFLCTDFIYHEDGFMFYGGRSSNENIFNDIFPKYYRLIKINSNNEIIEKHLPTRYNEVLLKTVLASEKNCLYYTNDNTLRLLERPNGLVYEISDTINSIYAVDFYKYTIPVVFFYDSNISEKDIRNIEKSDCCYLSSLVETDNYIYMTYVVNRYNRMISQCIYLKESDESVNIGPVWLNDIDKIAMPTIMTSYKNSLIGYYEADELKLMIDTNTNKLTQTITEIGMELKDSDNPIVCIIKLKDVS